MRAAWEGMYGFLRTPKWIAGHVLLVTLVTLFIMAGFWQLRRLDEVRTQQQTFSARATSEPVALEEALAVTDGDPAELVYRHVTVSGEYLADYGSMTLPTSRNGRPGNLLLTPLAPASGGTAVLVERGWVPYDREGIPPGQMAPPEGEVRVEGVLLPADEARGNDAVNDLGLVTAITPELLAPELGIELQPVFLRLLAQEPPQPGELPVAGAVPTFDEGNHLSYAVQWFSFAAIGLVGYPMLVVRTARERASQERDTPSVTWRAQ